MASEWTLKMASAQVVETSVTNNSPSQNSNHPDDLFQSRYVTPGFKPFSYFLIEAERVKYKKCVNFGVFTLQIVFQVSNAYIKLLLTT